MEKPAKQSINIPERLETSLGSGSPVEPASPRTPKSAHSRSSSRASGLSIDLSNLPALSTPTPPSNTILITNLADRTFFRPDHLQSFRENIEKDHACRMFIPLKSMERIMVVFFSVEAATAIRNQLDGENLMGHRIRVYFSGHTSEDLDKDQHLQAPEAKKLFFISPPPSPPVGWEMRNESAPNKEVHAEDLASRLRNLDWKPINDPSGDVEVLTPTDIELKIGGLPADRVKEVNKTVDGASASPLAPVSPSGISPKAAEAIRGRQRSGSMTNILAQNEGKTGNPGITVEDTTVEDGTGVATAGKAVEPVAAPLPHTSRPPVELMQE